jgi:hypothetical protein
MGMSTNVNTFVQEIPKDLLEQSQIMLSLTNLEEIDTDALSILPPQHIALLVLMERSPEQEQELVDWIATQQKLWNQVEEIAAEFVRVFDVEPSIPGWRAQPWAMALESKWGAGLLGAVEQARAWQVAQ